MTSWNAGNIPSMDGKVVIITGANSGIGETTAIELVKKGAHVIIACRHQQRGKEAEERINMIARVDKEYHPTGRAEYKPLDLGDLASIASFAADFKTSHERLDILINNAGVMGIQQLTKDGFESQFGINHLGHFALTSQLFDILKASAPSRIVSVSSLAHRQGVMDFDNFMPDPKQFRAIAVASTYCQSKLSNLLFAHELDRKLKASNISGIDSIACHPGCTVTNLLPKLAAGGQVLGLFPSVGNIISKILCQTADIGCLPTLYAAVSENAKGGEYFGPKAWAMWGEPALEVPYVNSRSLEDAKKLWEVSEKLTGVKFTV